MRNNQAREKSRTSSYFIAESFSSVESHKFSEYLGGVGEDAKAETQGPSTPLRSGRDDRLMRANLWDITLARTDTDGVQAEVAFFRRLMNSTKSGAGFSATG